MPCVSRRARARTARRTQSYILFRAQLAAPFTFSAGTESLEVGLFEPSAIPWGEIAFSSVAITLRSFVADMASGSWHIHHGASRAFFGGGGENGGCAWWCVGVRNDAITLALCACPCRGHMSAAAKCAVLVCAR
jgi:hypothetical protein